MVAFQRKKLALNQIQNGAPRFQAALESVRSARVAAGRGAVVEHRRRSIGLRGGRALAAAAAAGELRLVRKGPPGGCFWSASDPELVLEWSSPGGQDRRFSTHGHVQQADASPPAKTGMSWPM